ncbi:MAG: DUF883 family protein [Rhodoferax sp.]|jgi:hypothetical protein|nr:DUF883 family protein [Rhodoferax sp.]
MISIDAGQKNKLMNDLRLVIDDAQEMLRMTADQVGDGAVGVRARIEARLAEATRDLKHLQEAAVTQAKAAGHATDEFVQQHPWKSIGVAAGVGLLAGLLIARR